MLIYSCVIWTGDISSFSLTFHMGKLELMFMYLIGLLWGLDNILAHCGHSANIIAGRVAQAWGSASQMRIICICVRLWYMRWKPLFPMYSICLKYLLQAGALLVSRATVMNKVLSFPCGTYVTDFLLWANQNDYHSPFPLNLVLPEICWL